MRKARFPGVRRTRIERRCILASNAGHPTASMIVRARMVTSDSSYHRAVLASKQSKLQRILYNRKPRARGNLSRQGEESRNRAYDI